MLQICFAAPEFSTRCYAVLARAQRRYLPLRILMGFAPPKLAAGAEEIYLITA